MPRTAPALWIAAVIAMTAAPVLAEPARVTGRDQFVSLVEGRRMTALGVDLRIGADGTIAGRAFGRDVTGQWAWQSGWFCREMAWGSRVWDENCQLVTIDGSRMVFTADKGTGDTAGLTIR